MKYRLIWFSVLLIGLISLGGYAQAPVPFINLPLVPDATAPGGADFTLTVNGTGFVSGSVVNWNGSARPTTFVNSSKLTAVIPAAEIATAGTAWVTVVNPAPGGGTSNLAFFSISGPTASVSFAPAATYDPGGEQASSVAVADVNGDGKLDLVVTNCGGCYGPPSIHHSSSVGVLLGNGDGTFRPAVTYGSGGVDPSSLRLRTSTEMASPT